MRGRLLGLAVAVLGLQAGFASAACPPGQTRNCVNLDGLANIGQDVVAREPLAKGTNPSIAAKTDTTKPYTGPTVGLTNTVRRAPTVGYRWSLE